MRPRKLYLPMLAVLTVFFTVAATAVAFADTINADTDALATSPPNANGFTGTQDIGTSQSYAWSVTINNNGNSGDDVFAGGATVSFTVSCSGPSDWTVSCTHTAFTQSAYGQNDSGVVQVQVPSNTTNTGTQAVLVDIRADTSTGSLSPNEGNLPGVDARVVLHYNITATAPATPPNSAPNIDAGGPYSGDEGSDIAIDGASATDPDNDSLLYTWTRDDSGITNGGSCTLTSASTLSPTLNCNDNGSVTLTLKVDDQHGHAPTDQATVTVNNVAPVASSPSFTLNPWTGVANASFAFSDAGTNDTHTASFSWTGASSSVTESSGSGTASSSKTFSAGCYTLTVTGKVTDDDGADSNSVTLADNQQFPVYSAGFLPPIVDGERNIVKYGNVVPVKVSVTNPCTNAPVSANLFVSYYQGDGDAVDSTPVDVATSVATPDGTSGQMRLADGFYIFNFSTKPLTAGKDYTIRIWKDAIGTNNGGTVLLDAVLRPKK
jgi:hypothetical protein